MRLEEGWGWGVYLRVAYCYNYQNPGMEDWGGEEGGGGRIGAEVWRVHVQMNHNGIIMELRAWL